jgi:arylsulfatase A-like enzyme
MFSDSKRRSASRGTSRTRIAQNAARWRKRVRNLTIIVRYPGRIPAGSVCSAFLTSLEVVPTILQLAGAAAPSGLALDGYDMLPVLAAGAPSPRREMFWQRKDDKAARVGAWKWVESSRGGGLFDLTRDSGESQDLSTQRPEKLKELKARFTHWRRTMDAAAPRGPFRDY